jgi:threonine dehydrogenase-like Zn-dependent dehydrogenase
MRAAVYRGVEAVAIESVPEPPQPDSLELLLEVEMAAICGTDANEWRRGPQFCRPPVILGHEFVGRVVATGNESGFRVGDRVACGAGISCGTCSWCQAGRTNLCASYYTLGGQADGGLAEYVLSPASIFHRLPLEIDFASAVLAQPLSIALHAIRRSNARAGESVAVIGVGGIGAFIVAGLAARGCSPILAVDINEQRLETARTLGANQVLNVAGQDTATMIRSATAAEGASLVIEASGAPSSPAAALAATRRGGRVVLVGTQATPRELDLNAVLLGEVSLITTVAHVCSVDLPEALAILAERDLSSATVSKVIPLEALVEEGLRPVAEGTANGKIVIDPKA